MCDVCKWTKHGFITSPESKRQSKKWKYTDLKFKKKVLSSIFCKESQTNGSLRQYRIHHDDFLEKEATVKSAFY